MPIYEYACASCGHELEVLQKVNDAPLVDCPTCGAPKLRKKITAAAFRLKGTGWYETDFKRGAKRNLHDSGDRGGDSKGSSSDTKAGSSSQSASTPKESKTAAAA